jgi:hypothetical protein
MSIPILEKVKVNVMIFPYVIQSKPMNNIYAPVNNNIIKLFGGALWIE